VVPSLSLNPHDLGELIMTFTVKVVPLAAPEVVESTEEVATEQAEATNESQS
jgi:hypothetical protein